MSPRQVGARRDEAILDLAGRFPVSARQVAALLFRSPAGLRLARHRLQVLAARGDLRREYEGGVGWLYARRRDQLGRKRLHGHALADLYVRLSRSGALLAWQEEAPLPGGQADARTVLDCGEVWWEVERDRPFDRWTLHRGHALVVWTTERLAARCRYPDGVRGRAGHWGEDPLAVARRACAGPTEAPPTPTLRQELAGARLVWRVPAR